MTAKLPKIELDTRDLPGEQRFAAWQACLPHYEMALPAGASMDDFRASATVFLLGDMIIALANSSGLEAWRSPERIAADSRDNYVFFLVLRSVWTGRFEGRKLRAEAGDLLVLDLNRPFHMSIKDNSSIGLVIDRRMLDEALRVDTELHGHVFTGTAGRLLADHIRALASHLSQATQSDVNALRQATLALIVAAAAPLQTTKRNSGHIPRISHRARRYIEKNLTDKKLTPASLAKALDVPRTKLYEAFKPLGGIARYIQRRRLEAIRSLLMHPEEDRPIGELANSFGFTNLSHFTTAFRRAFGQPPRKLRMTKEWPGEAESNRDIADAPARLRKWRAGIEAEISTGKKNAR